MVEFCNTTELIPLPGTVDFNDVRIHVLLMRGVIGIHVLVDVMASYVTSCIRFWTLA